MQKRRHCIPVKILHKSDKGAFSYKFYLIFFFYTIFNLFLRPLNILSTSFHAKMVTLHPGRNSWPIETRGIYVQILHEFFFSFKRNFHFFLGPLNMLSTSFGAKMMTLHSGQNTWPIGQKGIFVQMLPDLFFYSFLFFVYRIFHSFLRPLNILSTSFREKMETLYSGRNSWPPRTRCIFVQISHELFFPFERIFQFFLGPLNMLSTSFGAKTMTLFSSQNTWPVGEKGIFVQTLPKIFYLFSFQ